MDRNRRRGLLVRPPWTRRLRFVPSALLVGVASVQIALAHTAGLSAWKGGGFGMFAATDAGATRHLHAFVKRPGLRREVLPPESLADRVERTLTLPTQAKLRELARDIAEFPTPDHGSPAAVEIQVWYTRFDPETLAPSGHILRGIELDLAAD